MKRYGKSKIEYPRLPQDAQDALPAVRSIAVPTLVINGVDEGVTDAAVAPFLEHIPDVAWVRFRRSTHMPHLEERADFMRVVAEWLRTGSHAPLDTRPRDFTLEKRKETHFALVRES